MKILDQHVHSDFSFDSNQEMEAYFIKAMEYRDEYFVTTEHLDLECFSMDNTDIIPDFEKQKKALKKLSKKYGVKPLFGVEVNFRKDIAPRINKLLKTQEFDLVLLGIHESDKYDVSRPEFQKGKTSDECYSEYLDYVFIAVTQHDDFDVLAHIDYSIRYLQETVDLSLHKEKLIKIFKVLIQKDKALELNTRLISRFNSVYYTEFILDLYLETGGEKLTLSSDAHRILDFKNHFERVILLLKEKNVNSLVYYKKRKPHKMTI